MAVVSMKQFLEAGVHYGHQTRRWNPKMRPYIFGSRNGIHIIDLQKSLRKLKDAYEFVRDLTARGESVLFVGTKPQAREIVREEASRSRSFYIDERWLGGLLTNFNTIKQSVGKLHKIEEMKGDDGLYTGVHQEGSPGHREEAPEAGKGSGRYPRHAQAAGCDLRDRLQEGTHRAHRGAEAGHPHRRGGGHQLRSGRHRLS